MALSPRILRRTLQEKGLYSGLRLEQLRRLPGQHRRLSWACRSSIANSGDAARCFSRFRPSLLKHLSRYQADTMSSTKRPYNAISGPRTPLAPLQDYESRGNIQSNQHGKSAGRSLPWKRQYSSSQAQSDTVTQQWSHRLYMTQAGKPIMVHYCGSLATTERVAEHFANEPVLGFDMEWKYPGATEGVIPENVSVIQLASRDRIAIFHIARFQPNSKLENFVSQKLKSIIENPKILKTGVNIKNDCTRLRKYLQIDARGTFELSHLYKLIKYCHTLPHKVNRARVSLAYQVQEHFGLPLAKERSVRCSDWHKPITAEQAHYAAADAYAGYRLFVTMDAKRKALKPVPPLPEHDELGLPIRIKEPSPEPELLVELTKTTAARRKRAQSVDSGVKVDTESLEATVKSAVVTRRRSRSV